MKYIILIIIFAACFADTFTPVDPRPHKCKYNHCPFRDQLYFTKGEDCFASECHALDSLHFQHPGADYDSLETILSTINK